MKKHQMRNQNGFTLIEVTVSALVLAIFFFMSASILSDIQDLNSKTTKEVSAETELSFAVRYMTGLLRDAGNSYNTLRGVPDNNGREFFDYIYDIGSSYWSDDEKVRVLTLGPETNRFEFVLILNDKEQTEQIFYQPVTAYAPQNAPADMMASAPLRYVGINNASVVSSLYPNLWRNGRLIMMKVPTPLRYVAADASVNIENAPREHLFLGQVQGDDLVLQNLGGLVHTTHPLDNRPVLTADTFLRTIPTVGGASPIVKFDAVKAIRVSLRQTGENALRDLVVEEFVNGQFQNPFMVATAVRSVTFKRESISSPIIGVQIAIEK